MKFILYMFVSFISIFGITYLYAKLVQAERINRKTMLVFFFGVIFMTLIKYYEINFFNIILFFLYYPLLFHLIKPLKFKKAVFYFFMVWFYGIILDFIFMIILSIVNYMGDVNIYSNIFIIGPTIVIGFLMIIGGHLKFLKRWIEKLYKVFDSIGYTDFLLIGFSLFILIMAIILSVYIKKIEIDVLLSLLVFLSIFILYLLIRVKCHEFENKLFIETLKKNYEYYIKTSDEYMIFKHNLIAKLLSVKSVSNKKARLLIDDLIKVYNNNIDFQISIKNIPYGLDGIINQKICNYQDKIDIKINNKISDDIFSLLRPRKYNVLVEKLSILLDNAIQACLKSTEKVLIINLIEEDNMILIEIKNTFKDVLDIEELGNIKYSTKGKRRGFGLYSVLRSNDVSTNVKIINEYFVSEIKVKKSY